MIITSLFWNEGPMLNGTFQGLTKAVVVRLERMTM